MFDKIRTVLSNRVRIWKLLWFYEPTQFLSLRSEGEQLVYDVSVNSDFHYFQNENVLIHNSLGLPYGATAFTVANKLHIPQAEADEAFAKHAKMFPKIRGWQDAIGREVLMTGEVKSPFGWTLKLRHWATSPSNRDRDYAKRRGWNIIQAVAAIGCMRLAHIKLYNAFWKEPTGEVSSSGVPVGKWFGQGIRPVLTIHDEAVLSVPKAILRPVIETVRAIVKSTTLPGWQVPMLCDFEIGNRVNEYVPLDIKFDSDGHITSLQVDAEKEKKSSETVISSTAPTSVPDFLLGSEESDESDSFGGVEY